MLNRLKKDNKGFTIIEVMIVLAIAGLILLIVFLAVPALQRNSRNTSRKSDAAAILAAISEYESNNNGALPTACSGTSPVQIGLAATGSQAKVGFYNGGCSTTAPATSGNIYLHAALTSGTVAALSNAAASDNVVIVPKGQCDATTNGQVDAGSARSVALQYLIENGANNYSPQCQDS